MKIVIKGTSSFKGVYRVRLGMVYGALGAYVGLAKLKELQHLQ